MCAIPLRVVVTIAHWDFHGSVPLVHPKRCYRPGGWVLWGYQAWPRRCVSARAGVRERCPRVRLNSRRRLAIRLGIFDVTRASSNSCILFVTQSAVHCPQSLECAPTFMLIVVGVCLVAEREYSLHLPVSSAKPG